MSEPLNFQSIMLKLQHFWAEQGCLIWQPYYAQVGAGTLNPATALRVLGPEPWNVAYIEPSIRPDDGRYGENPNRMQMHYQFQVILKPDPGNPQEIYLQSLEALGIDLRQHDIRFVEDNWESPALGAWGLGWEVWLDGQEITQYTYFQQAGGRLCDPVSVEITYGLDRIAIALQRVHGFTEIRWNDVFRAGDMNLVAEQEHSKYYFEAADVERVRLMFDLFQKEAEACLDHNLVLPAHDYLIKCSHTFNVLDARGVIGVTERQAYFGRMRDVARRVADAYLDQRQRMEYPFLRESPATAVQAPAPTQPVIQVASPFLLEIGTEELPASDLDSLLGQLRDQFPALLQEAHLAHGEINVQGTPRRLVITVNKLEPKQPDLELVVKGPPASKAFDSLGVPTKAAEGFARSRGVPVSALEIREMDGGQYVTAVVHQTGRSAVEVFKEKLPELLNGLRVEKPMRWNHSNVFFSRPIRWLLALYGDHCIPFTFAGVQARNLTRGLRLGQPVSVEITDFNAYFSFIESQGIILDRETRKKEIQSQIEQLAHEVGGTIQDDPGLLAEVANLVETPVAVRGSFDASHLVLPREILASVMKKHQRYFPIFKEGKMLPYFITVANRKRNASDDLSLIVSGNEHVIRARFADALFFVREDRKKPLKSYLERLETLTFQAKLGSMLDKVNRITQLVELTAPQLSLSPEETQVALKAAALCKADLTTHMVVEMTSLQGFIGGYYALQDGESQEVADAIYEHYLPRFTGDAAPRSKAGLAVGIADRLDTLVGLFAAGLAPTGAKDPFAQRRAALGLIQALIAHEIDFDLQKVIEQHAAPILPITVPVEIQNACLQFMIERLRNLMLDEGHRYDNVDAVITAQGQNPARASRAIAALGAWVNRPDWSNILPAYARCVRITRNLAGRQNLNPDQLIEPAEQALYQALQQAESIHRQPGSINDFLNAFLPMIPAINQFFDSVLVMTESDTLRNNRLGLLQRITMLADGVADFSRMEGF
jgi:glycyl-tRNA synthetase